MDANEILDLVALKRKIFDVANAARYDAQVAAESDPALIPAFEAAKAAQDDAATALGEAHDVLAAEINTRVAAL